jgi:hypothetical protein
MIEDIETAASSQDYTLEDGFVAPLPDYILANGFD